LKVFSHSTIDLYMVLVSFNEELKVTDPKLLDAEVSACIL